MFLCDEPQTSNQYTASPYSVLSGCCSSNCIKLDNFITAGKERNWTSKTSPFICRSLPLSRQGSFFSSLFLAKAREKPETLWLPAVLPVCPPPPHYQFCPNCIIYTSKYIYMYVYINIYIYMCVCVCVWGACVRARVCLRGKTPYRSEQKRTAQLVQRRLTQYGKMHMVLGAKIKAQFLKTL